MKPQPRTRKAPDLDQLRAAAATPVLKANGPDPAAPVNSNTGKTGTAGNASGAVTKKLTIRMDEDDLGRARSAWRLACANSGEYPSFTAWVVEQINTATRDVEIRLAGGHELTPTPAGVIPTGRPTSAR